MQRIGVGQGIIIAVLLGLLIGVGFLANSAWTSTTGVISPEGWLALGLGTFFSLVVGCGLIALVFYSSRHGYDDAVREFRPDHDEAGAPVESEGVESRRSWGP